MDLYIATGRRTTQRERRAYNTRQRNLRREYGAPKNERERVYFALEDLRDAIRAKQNTGRLVWTWVVKVDGMKPVKIARMPFLRPGSVWNWMTRPVVTPPGTPHGPNGYDFVGFDYAPETVTCTVGLRPY